MLSLSTQICHASNNPFTNRKTQTTALKIMPAPTHFIILIKQIFHLILTTANARITHRNLYYIIKSFHRIFFTIRLKILIFTGRFYPHTKLNGFYLCFHQDASTNLPVNIELNLFIIRFL